MDHANAQTVIQLSMALDLLLRRRKTLKFLAHCSARSYQDDARRELAMTDTRIETLRRTLQFAQA